MLSASDLQQELCSARLVWVERVVPSQKCGDAFLPKCSKCMVFGDGSRAIGTRRVVRYSHVSDLVLDRYQEVNREQVRAVSRRRQFVVMSRFRANVVSSQDEVQCLGGAAKGME